MRPTQLCLQIIPTTHDAPPHLFLPCDTAMQKQIMVLHDGCVRHGIMACDTPITVGLDEEGGHTQEAVLAVTRSGDITITIPGQGATFPLTVTRFWEMVNEKSADIVTYHGDADFLVTAPQTIARQRVEEGCDDNDDSFENPDVMLGSSRL